MDISFVLYVGDYYEQYDHEDSQADESYEGGLRPRKCEASIPSLLRCVAAFFGQQNVKCQGEPPHVGTLSTRLDEVQEYPGKLSAFLGCLPPYS